MGRPRTFQALCNGRSRRARLYCIPIRPPKIWQYGRCGNFGQRSLMETRDGHGAMHREPMFATQSSVDLDAAWWRYSHSWHRRYSEVRRRSWDVTGDLTVHAFPLVDVRHGSTEIIPNPCDERPESSSQLTPPFDGSSSSWGRRSERTRHYSTSKQSDYFTLASFSASLV